MSPLTHPRFYLSYSQLVFLSHVTRFTAGPLPGNRLQEKGALCLPSDALLMQLRTIFLHLSAGVHLAVAMV